MISWIIFLIIFIILVIAFWNLQKMWKIAKSTTPKWNKMNVQEKWFEILNLMWGKHGSKT